MEECRLLRMHECQQCGKRFKARGGLQQHLRIHSNDRPYQCRFCPKRFTQKSHVDQHERIHTGLLLTEIVDRVLEHFLHCDSRNEAWIHTVR